MLKRQAATVIPRLPRPVVSAISILLYAFIHVLLLGGVVVDANCTDHLHSSKKVLENGVVALTCADTNKTFPSGNLFMRAVLAFCYNDQWEPNEVEIPCQTPSSAVTTEACGTNAETPENARVAETITDTSSVVYANYYKCNTGMNWLSGRPGHLTECSNGQWTPILDKCDEDCPVPRDCTDIANFGFDQNETYNVMPSGDPHQSKTEVWCDFDTTEDVWTTVYRVSSSVSCAKSGTGTASDADGDYCIGLDNLAALTNQVNSTNRRPLVIQFLIETTDGKIYHATYDRFLMDGGDNYTLTSVGNYHGNAGDGFSASLNFNFLTKDSAAWWLPNDDAVYDILKDNLDLAFVGKKEWPTLTTVTPAKTIQGIHVRVRSHSYDREIACPLHNVMELGWQSDPPTTWYGHVPISRLVGTKINYTCVGDYMMEGTEGVYTTSGVIECLPGAEGESPSWSRTLNLPCQLVCPGDFKLSTNMTKCYQEGSEVVTFGITEAAQKCGELNSSLAVIDDLGDLTNLSEDNFYLTAHIYRPVGSGSGDPIQPPLPQNVPCSDCTFTGDNKCLTVNKKGEAVLQDCFGEDLLYLCQVPSYCPNDYTEYRGRCYKLITSTNSDFDLFTAQSTCESEGAALTYPETEDTLLYLSSIVQVRYIRRIYD
ncbi:uncharacterized protein LOC121874608 [Homarus americanus]|uniref:uncharacterized protein LOC121874608 n=1 Tax=Homarus americanus TaxID=6706 RepID=UPI001C4941F2|nr:uncharacterized protein LOC121874608 [Homarus americanus]